MLTMTTRVMIAAALALGFAFPDHAEAQAGCTIIITATGQYRVEVLTGGPFPVVNYINSSAPRFNTVRRGNQRLCQESPGTIRTSQSPNASSQLFHIANELFASASVDYWTSQRPQFARGLQSMAKLAGAIRRDLLASGIREIVANIAADLIKRYANPSSLLTDKGAKYVADTAVKLMIEHYAQGRDPGLIIDGLLNGMVDHLRGHVDTLTQAVGGDALKLALKPTLDSIANDVKAQLTAQLPDEQWVRADADGDRCTFDLNISWTPKNGQYRAVFSQRCGRQSDWISNVVITTTAVKPGEASQVTAQALSQLGTAFPLAGATITGLAAVMADGSAEPAAVMAGNTATFNFTAGKPRRDSRYPIRVTLTTDASTGRLTGSGNDGVTVENVPPRIQSVTPESASGEPGETLELKGTRVLVVDDNADRHNPSEVSARTLTLEHPAGLRTTPRFDRPDSPRQVSFDPGSGTYVFEFSRSGRIERPHEHDTWAARITIADNNSETADGAVNLEVEDVAPSMTVLRVAPQFVHTGDGQTIDITARVEDPNGVADIVSAFVDATAAGGQKYTLGADLIETARGEEHIDLRIAAPFGHVDPDGRYEIPAEVRDEKNTGTAASFLNVGNEAPQSTGTGFIHGGEVQQGEDASAVSVQAPRDLCPGDPFRVGMIASDPEGDPLIVTVTIVETGQQVELPRTSTNVYTAGMTAPGQPGTYTLLFEAKERPPGTKGAPAVKHQLTVHACENRKREITAGMAGEPIDVDAVRDPTVFNPAPVSGPRTDPAVQKMIAIVDSPTAVLQVGDAGTLGRRPRTVRAAGPGSPARFTGVRGFGSHERLSVTLPGSRDELWLAPVSGSSAHATQQEGAPAVRMVITSLGSSTGEALEVHIVNDGDQPVRITGGSLVLEPIARNAQQRIQREVRRIVAGGKATALRMNAYCLEFLRLPPVKGLIFRIAPPEVQGQFASARRVLQAARQLRDRGALSPDSEPGDYFHAIRQWALWTAEQRFDEASFTASWVEHTRKQFTATRRPWTRDVEQVLRQAAPGRWADIGKVLSAASADP